LSVGAEEGGAEEGRRVGETVGGGGLSLHLPVLE
jgi:hypothetical protein